MLFLIECPPFEPPKKVYLIKRTRNKGRSPVNDRPKLVSDRPNLDMAGHIDRSLFSDHIKQFQLRYSFQDFFEQYSLVPKNGGVQIVGGGGKSRGGTVDRQHF